MTDNKPKVTEENGGVASPQGKEQKTSDIREEVNQKLENIFGNLDDDEEAVGITGDGETPPVEKEQETVADSDQKVELKRADAVGSLDAEEEDVVDWVDDAPEPAGTATEITVGTPSLEKQPETGFDMQGQTDEVHEDLSGNLNDDSAPDGADETTDTQAPNRIATEMNLEPPSPVSNAIETTIPPAESATVAGPPAAESETEEHAIAPIRPEMKRPEPAAKTRSPAKPAPIEQTPRKPLTARIIVWGVVLILITCTVRYFASYGSEELAPAPAETGQLFYKVAPLPPFGPASAPTGPSAPLPPAGGSLQTAPPLKISAPAGTATAPVNAYVPRTYPYAIHMSSFQSPALAREVVAHYRKGLHAYLARVDLGDKGVWYRLYFGYFPTATAAMDAIQKYHLTDALVSRTRYACLLGSYLSAAQAATAAQQVTAKGFFSYTITTGGTHHVFVGAYLTLSGAKAQSKELSAASFTCHVIER